MNFEHLREFCVFADRLNVSESAKILNISQPTLSNHIAALEKEVGAPLVVHGRHPRLTQAGLYLVAQSSRLLKEHEECIAGLQDISRKEMSMTIAIDHCFSGCFENQKTFLASFLWDHPNFYMNEPEPNHASAFDILSKQGADGVCISYTPLSEDVEKGVRHEELPQFVPYRLSLWLDKRHPLAVKPSLKWTDLDGCRVMFHSANKLRANEVSQLFANHGASVKTVLSARSGTSFLQSVSANDLLVGDEYYEAMPVYSVHPTRQFIPINDTGAFPKSYLAYLPDRVSPAMEALLEYLRSFRQGNTQ